MELFGEAPSAEGQVAGSKHGGHQQAQLVGVGLTNQLGCGAKAQEDCPGWLARITVQIRRPTRKVQRLEAPQLRDWLQLGLAPTL